MQTYNDIIQILTEEQKIRLLTDLGYTCDPAMSKLGIPPISFKDPYKTETNNTFPSPAVIARSFDRELISEMSEIMITELHENGKYSIITPSAKSGIGYINSSISEDPYLSGLVAGAFLDGANRMGIYPFVDGYGCGSDKLHHVNAEKWSEEAPSERVVREHLITPFNVAFESGKCLGLFTEAQTDIHEDLLYQGKEGKKLFTLRKRVPDNELVKAVCRGDICINAQGSVLQKSLLTYRRFVSDIKHGRSTSTELADAIERGDAMSEEMLDRAVNNLLSLCFMSSEKAIGAQSPTSHDKEAIAVRAITASTVLLKNENGFLPLGISRKTNGSKNLSSFSKPRHHYNISVIGDILNLDEASIASVESTLCNAGHKFAGYAKGYSIDGRYDASLIIEAYELALNSDTVIIFLGTDTTDHLSTLPANQLALCDRLRKLQKQVIMVLSGDHAIDLSFTEQMECPPSAILLAPMATKGCASLICDMILGNVAPSGRLSETFIDNAAVSRCRRGLKTGSNIGYRFHDAVKAATLYPFGHGLTYTTFNYSSLEANSREVRFTVTNSGKLTGVEVAQVYLGINSSSAVRPLKELIGFKRLELHPGESKTVRIPLRQIPLYDQNGKALIEKGTYTVYVGSSVSDIKLTKSLTMGDASIEEGIDRSCDYFPTVTNIFKDNYTLEAELINMKTSSRNFIFSVVALILAIGVKIYDIVMMQNSWFLNIVSVLLCVGAILLFIFESIERKKKLLEEQQKVDDANRVKFENAENISVPSAELLFKNLENSDDGSSTSYLHNTHEATDEFDYFEDVNKELTASVAVSQLTKAALENGVSISKETASEILASMASSRLLLLKGMDKAQFNALAKILGIYFHCPSGIDTVDQSYKTEEDVLFHESLSAHERTPKNTFSVIQNALKNEHDIHIAFLDNVSLASMSEYFAPYAKYARSPFDSHAIIAKDPFGNNLYYRIPQNVWFVLNIQDGERLDNIPDYISEIATLNSWKLDIVLSSEKSIEAYEHFSFGQIMYLTSKAVAAFEINEDICKKIDRLEAFVKQFSEYHLGNKMWLGIEAYYAMLCAADVENENIIDRSLAVKLIPSVIASLSSKLSKEETGLGETLDAIFGYENTQHCRKVIKNSGADIT